MLTRHSPLHVPWPCRSRGWLVGESDGLSHPVRIQDGRPGCPLTSSTSQHCVRCGRRSRIDPAPARPMSTKKIPRADPRDMPRGPPRSKTVVPDPNRPTGTLLDRVLGDSHIQTRDATAVATSHAPVASGSASDRVASYHRTQSANRFQGKFFLTDRHFSKITRACISGLLCTRFPSSRPFGMARIQLSLGPPARPARR